MFDKIYNMIGDATPSYKDRLKSIDNFFKKYNLYKEWWPPQPDVPISIVWAVSTEFPELFSQQLGSVLQLDNIFNPRDELIVVADKNRRKDVEIVKNIKGPTVKLILVNRPVPGDGPAINWDVGASYATNDRLLFLRDLSLFFDPWRMFKKAREVNIKTTLTNFSVVLGPVWSRFCDRWLYLVHPRYAPNPFLFAFVLSKKNLEKMGGFDTKFGRGYDHTGELDTLLRWNMAGFDHQMTEDVFIFHPGISASSQEEMNRMQFESSVNRRYFFDRYGEEQINKLKPPYKADVNMVEVNHALTYDPLSEVILDDDSQQQKEPIKDAFTFSKWPTDMLVEEVL